MIAQRFDNRQAKFVQSKSLGRSQNSSPIGIQVFFYRKVLIKGDLTYFVAAE